MPSLFLYMFRRLCSIDESRYANVLVQYRLWYVHAQCFGIAMDAELW